MQDSLSIDIKCCIVNVLYIRGENMDKTTCKILLVDDEKKLADLVVSILKREGYSSIDVAEDCRGAEDNIIRNSYHLILLDVMLPDGNGFELYEKLCQLGYLSEIPVIFLSARDEDTARLRGLGLGADDYITKPFLTKELLLRIAAVLRRTYKLEEGTGLLRCGDALVDLDAGVVKHEGKEVSLTSKELALLQVLYRNRGKIVTMDALCNAVWPEGNYGLDLREKIEKDPSKPEFLTTVRGLGYKLEKNR